MNVTTTSSNYYVNSTSSGTGTHSNFTAQQYGPDNINDTLAEADVPVISGDTQQFVQNNTSDIDKNGDIGTASNFTTEQYNDGVLDTLAEADTNNSSPEKYSYFNNNGGVWTNPSNAYDSNTGTAATYTWSTSGYTAYLTLNLTYVTRGSKIRYWVGRSNTAVTNMTIDIGNQTGSWRNVYNATPTYSAYANASITFSQYTAVRFSFYKPGTTSRTVSVYETQGVNDTVLANYQVDLERQWTSAPYNVNGSKLLCIKTGTFSGEALEVDAWNGASWTVLNSSLVANAWNNISVSSYLTSTNFTITFIDTTRTGDTVQSTWQIDCVLLHTWNITDNYRLDIQEQWMNANYTETNKELDIFMGPFSSPAETLSVQWWNNTDSSWLTIIASLTANSWNNMSVTTYLTSSNFTIRFLDGTQIGDSVQSSWQIDAALLHVWTDYFQNVLSIANQNATTGYQAKLEIASMTGISSLSNFTGYLHDGTVSKQVEILNGVVTQSSGSWYTLAPSSSIYISLAVKRNSSGACVANLKLHVVKNGTVSPEFVQTITANVN
ncbi:MAG: hypothetical protein WBV70_02650 [Candidatus Bathyarchaeia archaeon]